MTPYIGQIVIYVDGFKVKHPAIVVSVKNGHIREAGIFEDHYFVRHVAAGEIQFLDGTVDVPQPSAVETLLEKWRAMNQQDVLISDAADDLEKAIEEDKTAK